MDLLVRVGVSDNGETGGERLSDRGETEGGNGVSNKGENRPLEEMELDEEENKLSGETESDDRENQPFEKGEKEMKMKREEVSYPCISTPTPLTLLHLRTLWEHSGTIPVTTPGSLPCAIFPIFW